jgi:hypothetical protein
LKTNQLSLRGHSYLRGHSLSNSPWIQGSLTTVTALSSHISLFSLPAMLVSECLRDFQTFRPCFLWRTQPEMPPSRFCFCFLPWGNLKHPWGSPWISPPQCELTLRLSKFCSAADNTETLPAHLPTGCLNPTQFSSYPFWELWSRQGNTGGQEDSITLGHVARVCLKVPNSKQLTKLQTWS